MSFNIEARKVQKTGGSSFIISLPKEWISKHGIEAKDTVGVLSQPDGNLLITPYMSSEKNIKEKRFDVDEIKESDFLFRLLIGAYIMGYNLIEVKSSKKFEPIIRDTIRNFSKITIGTEIMEESDNTVKIKDLLDPKEMPFEKTIKRMYILANSMHEDALKALETGDKRLAEKVIEIDDEIDRLNWLVERQAHIVLRDIILCQKLDITLEDASNYKFISRFLERIADHAVKIAKNVILIDYQKIDKKLYENIMKASEISLELLNMSLDAWLQKDLNLANENIESIKKLTNACNAIKINPNSEYLVEIGFIIESVRRTGEYSSDISEIIINNLI
ncbi:MAG: AbrB/MazE/SpoVT family DNA-binding domain-containing protein [Candidatus Lokiarchaeota archaeon]|nr:AbrB/MazE/SpoVT family DNA-binding domain-containing protein [Candidatus Lokiarchaeota archaeon]